MDATLKVSAETNLGAPQSGRVSKWKWAFLLAAIAGLLATGKFLDLQAQLKQALDWISSLGPWGAILFIALYVAATILFVPGSVLTIGAGALFGVVQGSLYVSIASTVGATGAFLIGRYLARDSIARKIEGNERFAAIDKAVAAEGWKIVGLTRLSPVFPFSLLNYAFGLTRVSLLDYALASWIGMMPGTVMYVYIGSLANGGGGQRARTLAEWVLYGVGLVATVVVSIFVTRIAKRTLAKKIMV